MTDRDRSYRSTLTSLDLLLRSLDRLQAEGKLPDDERLDAALIGAAMAVGLGALHFPDFKAELEKRRSPRAKVVPARRRSP